MVYHVSSWLLSLSSYNSKINFSKKEEQEAELNWDWDHAGQNKNIALTQGFYIHVELGKTACGSLWAGLPGFSKFSL